MSIWQPGTAARRADLLGRHGGVDRAHQVGVAQVGLDAGHEDVGGDGDERALERGALERERFAIGAW